MPIAATSKIHVWAGSLLRERREAKGLSQGSLAQLVGATRESVNEWESKGRAPGGAMVGKLAAILDCEPNDFYLTRELDETIASPDPTAE